MEVDLAQISGKKQLAEKVVTSYVDALQTPPDGELQTFDIGVNVCGSPQPTGDAKDQSFRASDKGKSVLIVSPYIDNSNRSNRGKGKAQVLFDTEDRESTSKASVCSDDSVESCNSERLMSRGKRASNYDLKMSVECKRSKKRFVEGSSSNSLSRQTGSFMNWALTITKGFSRFCEATALTSAPPLSNQVVGNLDCRSLSYEDGKGMGFRSVLESTYLLRSNVKNSTTANEIAKGLEAESKQFGYSNKYHSPSRWCNFRNLHIVRDEAGNELHNEVSLTEETIHKNIHQANEFTSAKSNVSRSNSRFHENLKCDSGPTGDLGSIGSTCSAPKNGCQSSPIGKRSGSIVAVSERSRKLVSQNKTELQNLWITRFSPKVSSTTAKHVQCTELGLQSSAKSYSALEPLSQNYAFHSKDLIAYKRQEHLKVGDEKFNSELIPMLPSYKVQKMEMPVSSFANRLNMYRCSKLSEVPDNVTLTTTTCFFCGKSSHGVRACT